MSRVEENRPVTRSIARIPIVSLFYPSGTSFPSQVCLGPMSWLYNLSHHILRGKMGGEQGKASDGHCTFKELHRKHLYPSTASIAHL